MTPHLSATTPSLLRKPYDATLGNDATLGDDDATRQQCHVAADDEGDDNNNDNGGCRGGSGKDNKDSGGDIQTTIN